MSVSQLLLQTALFGITCWLGLYLIARDIGRLQLWLTGLGLIAYASSVALHILGNFAPTIRLAFLFLNWQRFFILLPTLFWLGALILLIPNHTAWEDRLKRQRPILIVIIVAVVVYALIISVVSIAASLLPALWLTVLIGLDMVVLGVAMTMLDASDKGESWLPHLFRSMDYAFFTAVLFAGQVVLVMTAFIGINYPMVLLLLTTVATAAAIQAFADPVQALVDRIAFFASPDVRRTRADLRAANSAAQRLNTTLPLDTIDQAEFARLTRRALSQMGNLPKLASNPLTQLSLVDARLAQNGRSPDTLARANELKHILTESIIRLKPKTDRDFGRTDEWRHYNSLYFPYVLGLKPYSRSSQYMTESDTAVHDAYDWFRTQVPKRTLHNWQNAAAALIARDLRERTRRPQM